MEAEILITEDFENEDPTQVASIIICGNCSGVIEIDETSEQVRLFVKALMDEADFLELEIY